ncbi:MAG: phosphatase [Lachnospiraceae bacterium]|jgi:putative hydrolase|nr:phosphatase [Lachnospiraceae bacterium]MCH4029868.1 phosphatase [Lachnospiraceae bacterium]MCH4071338.1 phosphatase [Lachnospiraceae bacterium]MCH4109385.1 phosphatase [Lachnospiraceae bacterium]MCI1303119.1 phosphatase [Lachnospiraceae bacterium]
MRSYSLKCDCHTHTLYSRHAYSTIAENVRAAKEQGLELLASTDHFSGMLFPDWRDLRNYQYFSGYQMWPRVWDGVTLLHGAEVDITGLDGSLFGEDVPVSCTTVGQPFPRPWNLFSHTTRNCDFLIASVHGVQFASGCTKEQATQMYCSAMMRPRVLLIGHPGRSGVEFNIDEVVKFARDHHRLIELNEHSGDRFYGQDGVCRQIAEACMRYGTQVAVDTDAHICTNIGRFSRVEKMLGEIDFPEELIATRDRKAFEQALKSAQLSAE